MNPDTAAYGMIGATLAAFIFSGALVLVMMKIAGRTPSLHNDFPPDQFFDEGIFPEQEVSTKS